MLKQLAKLPNYKLAHLQVYPLVRTRWPVESTTVLSTKTTVSIERSMVMYNDVQWCSMMMQKHSWRFHKVLKSSIATCSWLTEMTFVQLFVKQISMKLQWSTIKDRKRSPCLRIRSKMRRSFPAAWLVPDLGRHAKARQENVLISKVIISKLDSKQFGFQPSGNRRAPGSIPAHSIALYGHHSGRAHDEAIKRGECHPPV